MFVDEIGEQPEALRDVCRFYEGVGAAVLERLAALYQRADAGPGGGGPILFTGMGSSLYAVDAVLPQLAAAGIDARVIEAGEWLHYGPKAPPPRSLVVAISQSGESVETRTVAERVAGHAPLVAVTNDPESRMARVADLTLPIQAGYEEMISTKSYTNTVGVLHLLAAALQSRDLNDARGALSSTAGAMEQALDPGLEQRVGQAAEWLDQARCIHAVARGPSLAAARGGALILGEGAHLAVMALPAGSFRHGPLELAGPGHVALVLAPQGRSRELMDRLVRDLRDAGSRVILLTDPSGETPESEDLTALPLHGVPDEQYFQLPAAILIERLLAAVAKRRGLVPGAFRLSGKITAAE